MDHKRWDDIAKSFARRRTSRRNAVKTSVAGLGVALLGRDHSVKARASDATPSAIETDKTTFLFVQSFESGALRPVEGTPVPGGPEYTLTVAHGLGQTLYFSDRPERIVGTIPTGDFLSGLGFSPVNPPNAALIADLGEGNEEIFVLELLNPSYDEESKTATYGVRILQDDERLGVTFQQEPKADRPETDTTYGVSHLFIDDCADQDVICAAGDYSHVIGDIGTYGACWSWSEGCMPCVGQAAINGQCNATFPACDNNCVAGPNPY